MSHLLVYVSELDPVAFLVAPALLLLEALVAILLPALRAPPSCSPGSTHPVPAG